jgi:phosphatidylinositol alpha-1,6-mannosyltransferase
MLATGGGSRPPSVRNPRLRWIFSTSLTRGELSRLRRRRRERAGDPPRVIIVCRQVEAKGAGTVIKALPEIVRTVSGVHLDVVGDGPARVTFHRLAGDLGMADRVTFHGAVGHERVLELLRRADVFCFPTRSSEGFPKVVLEAMACGLPVIASRVSVLPTLLGGGAGIVLDEPSAHAVARAVQYCLRDPAAYARLSSRAIHVAQDFSLERWAGDIGSELTRAWGPLQQPEIGHGTRRRASTAR